MLRDGVGERWVVWGGVVVGGSPGTHVLHASQGDVLSVFIFLYKRREKTHPSVSLLIKKWCGETDCQEQGDGK